MHGGELVVPSFDEFLQTQRNAGFDRIVVFNRDTETRDGKAPHNDWVLELAEEYADFFVPFFAIDPNKGKAGIRALEKAVERGVRGVKIHPYGAELRPNDHRAYALYDAVQSMELPMVFHTGPGPLGTRADLSHVRHFDDLCVDFPRLRIILAHMGSDAFMTAQMLAWRYENVFLDIAFVPEVYLQHMPWKLFEETIADKIMLGSDFPLVSPSERLETVDRLPVSTGMKKLISGDNAARLLQLA
jgi:predicted TIM-barrel fold metal-dependent hydrolase